MRIMEIAEAILDTLNVSSVTEKDVQRAQKDPVRFALEKGASDREACLFWSKVSYRFLPSVEFINGQLVSFTEGRSYPEDVFDFKPNNVTRDGAIYKIGPNFLGFNAWFVVIQGMKPEAGLLFEEVDLYAEAIGKSFDRECAHYLARNIRGSSGCQFPDWLNIMCSNGEPSASDYQNLNDVWEANHYCLNPSIIREYYAESWSTPDVSHEYTRQRLNLWRKYDLL